MKQLLINCEGGLCNRLGSLVGGIWISKQYQLTPVIHWPDTKWCSCNFTDLFDLDNKLEEVTTTEFELFVHNSNNTYFTHTRFDFPINQLLPTKDNFDQILSQKSLQLVGYNCNIVPNFIDDYEVVGVLSRLRIKEEIIDAVRLFCNHNLINHNTQGVHIRKTDYEEFIREDVVFDFVKTNISSRFFICSDSGETEKKFKALGNVMCYPKSSYVQKLDASIGWVDNIFRSKQSVIEAFVDLLILSRTNIVLGHPVSTFFKFANLYQNLEII